jgi:hypothetical protein
MHATSDGPVKLPPAPPGAKLSFRSESGQQIIARNAGVAEQAGTTVQNAAEALAHIEGQFTRQAQSVMQQMVGDPTELYQWLRGTDEGREAMRQAALTQVHDRSLEGWREATRALWHRS